MKSVEPVFPAAALRRRCGLSSREHSIGDSVSATIAGDRDGADQREGEFGEQRAGQAALEADRHIDRDQHDRHGDDRAAEFARRLDRGVDRLHALFEMAVDVLDHDDGVVDHKPDGQHQRQQREQIDREAEAPA